MGRVALLLISFVGLVALACATGGGTEPSVRPTPASAPTEPVTPVAPTGEAGLTNAPEYQRMLTYEGSGQAVHPDVVYFPDGWHGFAYWMAMTPHPFDTAERENPSILASHDGLDWVIPSGVRNPVVARPPCDHNSDPDLVYNPDTDELLLYYTEVRRSEYCGAGTNENFVKLVRSTDGVNWTEPQTVMSFDLDIYPVYVSPSVVYRDGQFQMWMASNTNALIHTTSRDGVTWSPVEELAQAPRLWHVDVVYVEPKAEYWMLFVDSPLSGAILGLATSQDGLAWSSCQAPVLTPSLSWDNDRIYRSTFLYEEGIDLLRIWYSARSDAAEWRIGYTQGGYEELRSAIC